MPKAKNTANISQAEDQYCGPAKVKPLIADTAINHALGLNI